MEANNIIICLENYVKFYIENKKRNIILSGINIHPEDASSSRGILPIIFEKIKEDAEICKNVMPIDTYHNIFGWIDYIDVTDDDRTLLGVMLKPSNNQDIKISRYMILSCCHKALDEIYGLYPSMDLNVELLFKGTEDAEIRPAGQ